MYRDTRWRNTLTGISSESFSEVMYVFEISKALEPVMGYLLQMWQTRPEDWPLLVWELDGFSLPEAKARAERLANQRVPVIVEGEGP